MDLARLCHSRGGLKSVELNALGNHGSGKPFNQEQLHTKRIIRALLAHKRKALLTHVKQPSPL